MRRFRPLPIAVLALYLFVIPGSGAGRAPFGTVDLARPPIVASPIPFPASRKREMRRYAQRHYGIGTYRLLRPRVIVEHFTGTDSYRSAYDTFARDVPDPELHELPGLCAHFVIDRRGVIHQLVSVRLMCRHTVGLNWTAIGIEHVGTSDQQVVSNARQLRASLRLTGWLHGRFGIATRNVIGHNESLSSPYHRERVKALRRQTHGDFTHATMQRYRARLRRLDAGPSRASDPPSRLVRLGRSVRGRPIDAVAVGPNSRARRSLLVVGCIHGDETAGIAVARRIERASPPRGTGIWVVPDLNPDGVARHTRQNARGVDLNRNFPRHWRHLGHRGDQQYSGPRPLSEPEARIAHALILRLRPQITIWFHQPLGLVDRSGGELAIERRFAEVARLPLRRISPYPGTATRWQNDRLPRTTAFVVELPRSPLGERRLDRFSSAVMALARRLSHGAGKSGTITR